MLNWNLYQFLSTLVCLQGVCEAGESTTCATDCGPFALYTPTYTSGTFSIPNGVMFDITSTVDVYISGLFTAHTAGTPSITLYTKPNSFQDSISNQNDWTVIGSSSFTVQNDYDSVGFNDFDRIKLEAGSTQGFYFASTGLLRALINSPTVTDDRIEIKSPGLIFGTTPFVPFTSTDRSLWEIPIICAKSLCGIFSFQVLTSNSIFFYRIHYAI